MSVYVDTLIDYGFRLGPTCHLVADTTDELNSFAKSIGMKLEWLQMSKNETPHYDLVERRRIAAVSKGAIELDRREFVKKITEIKSKQQSV